MCAVHSFCSGITKVCFNHMPGEIGTAIPAFQSRWILPAEWMALVESRIRFLTTCVNFGYFAGIAALYDSMSAI
jgi:hypothetical protein